MWQLSYLLRRFLPRSLAPSREALVFACVSAALLTLFALARGLVHIPGTLIIPPVLEERTLPGGTHLVTQVVPAKVYRGLQLYINGQWHTAWCHPQHLCLGSALYRASNGRVTDREVLLRVTFDQGSVRRTLFTSPVKVAAIYLEQSEQPLYVDPRLDSSAASTAAKR